ncbi:MAG TPA: methyltransferase domain-containing protein [Caulobacteraceae bacterium]|nr:methyltransferase domain-containing protein [Caulobacteraceae bacterium]
MDEDEAEVTCDRILDRRLTLRQAAKGYRAGADAALLAAACDASAGERVLEAGCGVGAVLLAAAWRRPGASFVGIERDPAMLRLAQENVRANGFGHRIALRAGDVGTGLPPGLAGFDAALANPPFFDDPARLRAPHPAKTGAWIAEDGLGAWLDLLLKALRRGGSLTLVHRADRLADVLTWLGGKAGALQVRAVHPYADVPAKRVLVRAVKEAKAPLQLLTPLVLHERGGAKHTDEAEAILRGRADLPWR